jgi:hypothetical protein
MECYYDTLFEVNCPAIEDLRNVPCAYEYGGAPFSMKTPWQVYTRFTHVDMKLFKKMEWISKCGAFANGYLARFVSRKSPIVRYVLKLENKFEWYERSPGFWDYRVIPVIPTCYYLGTYPVYWNVDNKIVVYPDNLMTPNAYPMGNKANIPKRVKGMGLIEWLKEAEETGGTPFEFLADVERKDLRDVVGEFGMDNVLNYLKPERITKKLTFDEETALRELNSKIGQILSEYTLRYDREFLYDYVLQDDWIQKRDKAFKECIARMYPKKPREPTTRVPTALGPSDWPGKPMEELEKPIPERTPTPFPKEGERLFRLRFWYGIRYGVPYNALELRLEIEERF